MQYCYTTTERGLVPLKLLQYNIQSQRFPRDISELRATLYSGPGQRMKSHRWFGNGISMMLIMTCGANGVSINRSSSTDFPYRRLGLEPVHSPASGGPILAGYLTPAVLFWMLGIAYFSERRIGTNV
jgi:hypothetical protein